ncbi:MAG: RNA polymerase sigma factor [Bacteroidota bacterium]
MKISPEALKDILAGCAKGDPKSQQWVFETHYGKMLVVCLRYAENMDEAKDILQDGFIKVFDKIGKFDGKGSLEGWIRRVIVNTAIDAIRKKKANMFTSFEDQEEKLSDSIEEETFEDEFEFSANDVLNALHQISPAYRTVFNLYVLEGHTHKEIAEKLGISEGTSKSNLAKAKQRIKKILTTKIGKKVDETI